MLPHPLNETELSYENDHKAKGKVQRTYILNTMKSALQ